jgi:hypothetical protein
MDAHHYRPHRQTGRVSDALDRLAELSDIDDRIRGHVFGLAEYHESEAASAYPLFDLAEIADLTHAICADDPKLADTLAYIAEAESPSIAVMMAAIKDRIDRFTDASTVAR